MAMANWSVNGSIAANLPVQTCRSKLPILANSCENLGDSFPDITGFVTFEQIVSISASVS
jgi:hypothetical protein